MKTPSQHSEPQAFRPIDMPSDLRDLAAEIIGPEAAGGVRFIRREGRRIVIGMPAGYTLNLPTDRTELVEALRPAVAALLGTR